MGGYDLQDQPSWCAQVKHSSRPLHIQLIVTHIRDKAAAPSAPDGSWLMPGIVSTVSLSSGQIDGDDRSYRSDRRPGKGEGGQRSQGQDSYVMPKDEICVWSLRGS